MRKIDEGKVIDRLIKPHWRSRTWSGHGRGRIHHADADDPQSQLPKLNTHRYWVGAGTVESFRHPVGRPEVRNPLKFDRLSVHGSKGALVALQSRGIRIRRPWVSRLVRVLGVPPKELALDSGLGDT